MSRARPGSEGKGEPHAIVRVATHLLAIPSSRVEEMFLLGETRRQPGAPEHQRGVVSLRGRVLPVVDVRVCLGAESAVSEVESFVRLLSDREQDHRSWLAELEASVKERRPFGLTTDPHQCKFGRWYDAYRSENVVIAAELARFAQPHAAIHAVAIDVERLKAEGRAEEALRRVVAARTGVLSELVALFERTRNAVRAEHREIGVVTRLGAQAAVLAVDGAEAVAHVDAIAGDDDPVGSGALALDLVRALVRWRERPQPVLVLDLERVAALAA